MNAIKKYIPNSFKNVYKANRSRLNIIKDYYFDYQKFTKHSASISQDSKDRLESYLIKEYHAIEKGLALRIPRPGFGLIRVNALLNSLDLYQKNYGDDDTVKITISALHEYLSFNANHSGKEFDVLRKRIQEKLSSFSQQNEFTGGTKPVNKGDILSSIDFNFEKFLKSRYSVRDFTAEPVKTEQLLHAIDLARFTPSACNRQAWRVTLVEHSNDELKAKLLDIQNGNSGFRDQISALLVITGKLSSFYDYERHQVYIDGGMFAMTLLLSLHAQGLGTCCLNMSVNTERGKNFTDALGISEENVPIMYIAVGNLKDEFKVAKSVRKDLLEIVIKP